IPSEIVPTWAQRSHWRGQPRAQFDEAAYPRGRNFFYCKPHPLPLLVKTGFPQALHPPPDAGGSFALPPPFHQPPNPPLPDRGRQHGMGNEAAFDCCATKSPCNYGKPDSCGKTDGPIAEHYCDARACQHHGYRSPSRRLLIDAEIKDDAKAKPDREPGHQTACHGLEQQPFANSSRRIARYIREPSGPGPDGLRACCAPGCSVRPPRFSSTARSILVCHCAASPSTDSGSLSDSGGFRQALTVVIRRAWKPLAAWPTYRADRPCD